MLAEKFAAVDDWLNQNGYSVPLKKWDNIKFSNEPATFHRMFVDVVKSHFGDLGPKEFSALWNENRIALYKSLNAPQCILAMHEENLEKLRKGKGTQCSLAALLNFSKKKAAQ